MNVHAFRKLKEKGKLNSVIVRPFSDDDSTWIVVFGYENTELPITTVYGDPKEYRRLPAAIEDVRRVGFSEAVIKIPSEPFIIRKDTRNMREKSPA
jgi:hypothetical protein